MDDFNIVIDLDKLVSRNKSIPRIGDIIQKAVDNGVQELCERLIEKIKDNLFNYGLGDSNLAQTINIQITDDGISIMMDSDYALFVEYGTGIVGANNPHPNTSIGNWKYDVNEHGEKGWFYPTTDSDPNPYKRMYDGQLYGWTRGLPSRPFMYDTWLWGTRSANNIINKHIRRELKKLESEFN